MVAYQKDVVITLVDRMIDGVNYILWIDTEDRLWETENGVNKEVDGYDKRKLLNIYFGKNGKF